MSMPLADFEPIVSVLEPSDIAPTSGVAIILIQYLNITFYEKEPG
jgi:hypothetical protein